MYIVLSYFAVQQQVTDTDPKKFCSETTIHFTHGSAGQQRLVPSELVVLGCTDWFTHLSAGGSAAVDVL